MIHRWFLLVKISEWGSTVYLFISILHSIAEEEEKMASQAKNTFEIPKWLVKIPSFLYEEIKDCFLGLENP